MERHFHTRILDCNLDNLHRDLPSKTRKAHWPSTTAKMNGAFDVKDDCWQGTLYHFHPEFEQIEALGS